MGTGGRGAVEARLEIATGMISGRPGSEDGLRKGKPKFNSDASSRGAGVDSSRIDSGSKREISDISNTSDRVNCDRRCDRAVTMVMDANIDKVSGGEESSTERRANGSNFLVGVIRTARGVVACSNQFS